MLRRKANASTKEGGYSIVGGNNNVENSDMVDPDRKGRRDSRWLWSMVALLFGVGPLFLIKTTKHETVTIHMADAAANNNNSVNNSNQTSSESNIPLHPHVTRCPANATLVVQHSENDKDRVVPEPMWMPSIAAGVDASGPDDYSKPLFAALTGGHFESKNYHAFGKSFKRCHTLAKDKNKTPQQNPGVACATSHPQVSVSVHLTSMFDGHVLLGLRNFPMAFYAAASFKDNKYHDKVGCMPLETWRTTRDAWVASAWEDWKKLLVEWHVGDVVNNPKFPNYYHVAMHLVHEHLVDPVRGPVAIAQLAQVLGQAGFSTTIPGDKDADQNNIAAACVWDRSLAAHVAFERDYFQYVPPYTRAQRTQMVQDLSDLRQTAEAWPNAGNLPSILDEYRQQVETWPIDEDGGDDKHEDVPAEHHQQQQQQHANKTLLGSDHPEAPEAVQ